MCRRSELPRAGEGECASGPISGVPCATTMGGGRPLAESNHAHACPRPSQRPRWWCEIALRVAILALLLLALRLIGFHSAARIVQLHAVNKEPGCRLGRGGALCVWCGTRQPGAHLSRPELGLANVAERGSPSLSPQAPMQPFVTRSMPAYSLPYWVHYSRSEFFA